MIKWIKRKLGIELLENEVQKLYKLECYTLADVADRLEESMIIIAGDDMMLQNLNVVVPSEKKAGILFLGSRNTVNGGYFRGQKIKTTTEYVEDDPDYDSLQGSIIDE